MSLDQQQTFRVPANVLPRAVGEELVLLDLDSDRYFGLNQTGARIWTLLAEGCSVGVTVQTVRQEYDTDEGSVRADLETLVATLLERGLIERAG